MIVDPEHDNMAKKALDDSPPSYEDANNHAASSSSGPIPLPLQPYIMQPHPIPPPMVYNYMHPATKQLITTSLPPDHPEMVCLQAGEHVTETKFGLLGVLVAIFWFPIGIGLCLLDRRVKCIRCGTILNDGVCS